MNQANFKFKERPIFFLIAKGLGEGEDDGGNGDTTFTQEQLDTAVSSALEKAQTEVDAGLKSKNAELLKSVKDLTKASKKFEGVDLDNLLALKETIANDEILSLLAEGKHSEALDKQTERMTVTHAAEIEALNTQITELTESGSKNSALVDSLLIDGGAKASFIAAEGRKEAVDDIALRARQVWKVEEGILVARDSKKNLMQGEEGPLTMNEWVESLKKTAPHLFPDSVSGGGDGGDEDTPSGDSGTLENQMIKAAEAGDQAKLRELSDKLRKKKRGR